MARWRTDGAGVWWLEGWASRETLQAYAARQGHTLDSWSKLVDAGPYQLEIGRCAHCNLTAAWGLHYRGKIAESIADEPANADPWLRLYRGKHRKAIGVMYGPALRNRCTCPVGRD